MLLPTPTPDASQWNIGCIGSLALGLCVGNVHFMFFVLISFASDTRRKPVFQWNMGLKVHLKRIMSQIHNVGPSFCLMKYQKELQLKFPGI